MKILMMAIFIISTSMHLYASALKNRKWRNYTKPFILASLIGYYWIASDDAKAVVILALLTSWLGDLFLMIKGTKWFMIGGVFFLISHIFFVFSYNIDVDFALINPLYIFLIASFFFIVVTLIFSQLKKILPKKLVGILYLYLLINGTMNSFAIFRTLSLASPAHITTMIGAILFFISDSCLFFVRFSKKMEQQNHFWVMLTYSIGELLIVIGLL